MFIVFICVFTFSTVIYDYIGIYVVKISLLKIGRGVRDIELLCQG